MEGVWAGPDGIAPALVPWPCCAGLSHPRASISAPCPVGLRGFAQALLFHTALFHLGNKAAQGASSHHTSSIKHRSCKGQAPQRARAGTGCSPRDECCWKALQQPSRRSLILSNP